MVIVYFDTSLLEYESEPGIPPYFLRLVGPIQLYLHWPLGVPLIRILCFSNKLTAVFYLKKPGKGVLIL